MKAYGATTVNLTPIAQQGRPRPFKNTGILIILLWTFNCFAVLVYPDYFEETTIAFYGAIVVFLPLAGILSLLFKSHYKVISYGLRLMAVSIFIYNLLLATKSYLNGPFAIIKTVMAVLAAIGLVGVFPNVMSLGMDQLINAPSSAITSYISWIAWIVFLANFLLPVTQTCIPNCYKIGTPFLSLLLPILCTLSVVSDILLNQWIVKEQPKSNPLKLIFQVLKYAASNKYPHLRSAFAIWDEKCSRLDLGKAKYGGPFTTEQVEDVKTFFRILPVLIVAALFSCTMSILGYSLNTEMFHYQDNNFMSDCSSSVKHYLMNCYERLTILYLPNLVIIVLVPVQEWLIYPFLIKHKVDKIRILYKLIIGTFLLLAVQLFHLSVEAIGTHLNGSENTTCVLQANESDLVNDKVIHISYQWLVIPQFFLGLSVYALYTGIMEFICAQSPYSMRGLLFGITFCVCFLQFSLSFFILQKLQAIIEPNSPKSCGTWFYASLGLLTLLVLGVGVCVSKWYSPRKREDNNERQLISSYKET